MTERLTLLCRRIAAVSAVLFAIWGPVMGLTAASAAEGAAPPAAASAWQAGPKAKVRLIAATTAVGDLKTLPLGLEVELEPGWKTYWRSPGDAGIPPNVDWTGSDNIAASTFRWPAPERFMYYDIETFGYHGRVVFPIDVAVGEPGRPVILRARADLLVCADVCIPHTMNLALDLGVGPAMSSGEAYLIDRFRALVPGDGARAGLSLETVSAGPAAAAPVLRIAARSVVPFEKPDLIVEGAEDILFAPPAVERLEGGTLARFSIAVRDAYDATKTVDLSARPLTLTLVDGNRSMEAHTTPALADASAAGIGVPQTAEVSLLLIVGLAVLGGLILNLMPCVLPVLAIKLLAVVGHGGGERTHVRRGFLASTAGIVTAFMLLAALAAGLKAAGLTVGWGIQFQQPLFIVAMVVILTLFACNMLGWFEIRLPGAVANAAARAGGHDGGNTLAGHFLQGAFATLLATPCSAPFLGTAVGFALSRGTGEIFTVFAALGFGMALPFLAVAAVPGLATRLPRPGPWMIWLKRLLALALAATALWLLSVLEAQASVVTALAVALLMAAAALLLALRRTVFSGFARGVPALVATIGLFAFALPATMSAPRLADGARSAPTAAQSAGWQPFDAAAIPALVAGGRIVFVDVTADWCITCQVNKRRVLDVGAVAAALGSDRIVRMQADWTSPDRKISEYLAGFGRYGIPFNIVYGPDTPAGTVLPELLTDAAVLDALAAADRSRTVAAK